jgi:hypothetical protein
MAVVAAAFRRSSAGLQRQLIGAHSGRGHWLRGAGIMELLGSFGAEGVPLWIFALAWIVFVVYLAFERQ